jgi:hypothetical protein
MITFQRGSKGGCGRADLLKNMAQLIDLEVNKLGMQKTLFIQKRSNQTSVFFSSKSTEFN